jgi:hypothetical protein
LSSSLSKRWAPARGLRVVETGFAQLPPGSRRETYDSHAEGWASQLGELADYLDAV